MSKSKGNLAALRAHIDATPELHTMSDADVAAELNGLTVQRRGGVPMNEVLLWVARHKVRASLKAKAGTASVSDLVENALALLDNPHVSDLNVDDPSVSVLMAELVSKGAITAEAAAELVEMAPSHDVSVAEMVFGHGVSSSDIAHARGLS